MKKKVLVGVAILAALLLAAGLIVFMGNDLQKAKFVMPDISAMTIPNIILNPIGSVLPDSITTEPKDRSKDIFLGGKEAANTKYAFKLKIQGHSVLVKKGVDENTLSKNPGWMESSAMPGEEGVCVVLGHRNKEHLAVLEHVKIGDVIKVSMLNGISYKYEITSLNIVENDFKLRLPAREGETIMLVTCYPFQYSGHAPKKYVVIGTMAN